METHLKECPFCGGIGIHIDAPEDSTESDLITCEDCSAQAQPEHWNTRPQSLTEKVKLEPLDEYLLKDFMLDYECKLNGSVLCNDEYMDYVRGLAKSICQRFGKQSLTEKVKWPEKSTGVCMCDCLYCKTHSDCKECECGNYKGRTKNEVCFERCCCDDTWDECLEKCKQSLNQASQEDTRELEDLINLHCQRIIDEGKVMLVYGGLARAILKEYVLVRREK